MSAETAVPETINAVLDVLAERFGSTGEHLWEVMVQQAQLEGFIAVLGAFLLFILSILAYRKFDKLEKEATYDREEW